jgi:hypothetical protein
MSCTQEGEERKDVDDKMSLLTLDKFRFEITSLGVDSFDEISTCGRFKGVDEHCLFVDEQ